MDKFRKWIKKNKKNILLKEDEISILFDNDGISYDIDEFGSGYIEIPKQMLTGYKIEYLIEEGADIEDICLYIESIDMLNNYLDKIIKE